MAENCSSTDKAVSTAVIRANKQIGRRFYRLRLEFPGPGAEAFANFKPGQFVQLDVSGAGLPPSESILEELRDAATRNILLRRPFSFADVSVEGKRTFAELLYCIVGPATLRMTTLAAGDSISVIGPLGKGFWVPDGKKSALLVSGGTGNPPLQCLAKLLTARHCDIDVIAFVGAKTANDLPFEGQLDEISQQLGFSVPEFARYGIKSQVATDDGSAGFHGPVTDCLSRWLEHSRVAREELIIYACGPERMLAGVAEIARQENIDCQVSMERRMACGIGLCQSCTVQCRANGSNETVYKLCCKDGPVFDSREVTFKL